MNLELIIRNFRRSKNEKTGYLILLLILVMTGCGKKQEEVIEKKVKYVITEPATMRKMNQVFKSDDCTGT